MTIIEMDDNMASLAIFLLQSRCTAYSDDYSNDFHLPAKLQKVNESFYQSCCSNPQHGKPS